MISLKALIIDDEPLAHQVILKYAANLPFLKIVGRCHRAVEAYPLLQAQKIDLLFLDINMPKLKGLDFLRTLETPPRVIVTSAYEEYALEGYELRVVDYLLKPFSFERFVKAVTAVQRSLAPAAAAPKTDKLNVIQPVANELFVKVDKRHLRIKLDELSYLESYGNYVKLWTGKDFHLVPRTLSSFTAELPDYFVQVHKSFMVNRRQIEFVEGAMIALRNGKTVPVGKSYRTMVRRWFS